MNNDAGKTSHIEIVQNPDVVEFLKSCSFMREPTGDEVDEIINSFVTVENFENENLPENLITINSSSYEAHVRNDIPYTNIGYVKLVTTLLKNNELLELARDKFVDPFRVAKVMDEKETISFVLPSSNIKYEDCDTTVESFRRALDNFFENTRDKKQERNTSLKSTLYWLASYADSNDVDKIVLPKCPYDDCSGENIIVYDIEESQFCPHCGKRIYATDRLRLYEEVDDFAPSNQGALGRFEKLMRHIYLAHLLRLIRLNNKETYLKVLNDLAIIINGPLAVMGTAAWVHGCLMKIINEINVELRSKGYNDLLIIGIINEGQTIWSYAKLIQKHIPKQTILCVSDEFRDKYINYNRQASSTTFGAETYYGQDFIWKTQNDNIMIFDLPYFTKDKSSKNSFKTEKSDYTKYNNLSRTLCLLQDMRSDMDTSSITPLVVSKQYTTISMEPGSKVLDLLSKNHIID